MHCHALFMGSQILKLLTHTSAFRQPPAFLTKELQPKTREELEAAEKEVWEKKQRLDSTAFRPPLDEQPSRPRRLQLQLAWLTTRRSKQSERFLRQELQAKKKWRPSSFSSFSLLFSIFLSSPFLSFLSFSLFLFSHAPFLASFVSTQFLYLEKQLLRRDESSLSKRRLTKRKGLRRKLETEDILLLDG